MHRPSLFVMCVALLVLACGPEADAVSAGTPDATEKKPPPLIDTVGTFIPGKSLGSITLGENATSAFQGLDSLTYTKATGGQSTSAYVIDDNGTPANLDVMTAPDSNSMNIQRVILIRCTAGKYKNARGQGVGTPLRELGETYALRPIATFSQEGKASSLYGSEQGVFFEFHKDSICRATVVGPANSNPEKLYQALYNNFTSVNSQ